MPLALDLKKLGSAIIRNSSTSGEIARVIAGPLNKDGKPNFIQKALNLGKKVLVPVLMKLNEWGAAVSGSLLKTLSSWGWSAISWVLGQIPSIVTGTWNFNWNASDEELDKPWANFVNSLAGQLGGTIGNSLGWLVCGAVPGLLMLKFNKLLALRVLKEVGEEALDELASNLWLLVNTIAKGLLRAGAVNLYKGTRRAIKKIVSGDSDWAKGFSMLAGPGAVESIKKWGEKGSKPYSFAIKQEEYIESFDAGPVASFVEELIEEFQDACTEAWYVVANATDEWIQQQRFAKESIHGEQDVVEIYPNRDNEEEKIILAGPQELLKPAIVNTITHYQMLEDRNIGNFMGEPVEALVNREFTTLMARIQFSSNPDKLVNPTSVTLYNVDKAKIDDWDKVIKACGGSNGYLWGPWQVNASLDDDTLIRVWAGSESEGQDMVEGMAELVKGEILTINSYHELKEGKRKTYKSLYKTPRKQYPYRLLIINPIAVLNEENALTTKKGYYQKREAALPLNTDKKPDNWAETLTELFATPGPSSF